MVDIHQFPNKAIADTLVRKVLFRQDMSAFFGNDFYIDTPPFTSKLGGFMDQVRNLNKQLLSEAAGHDFIGFAWSEQSQDYLVIHRQGYVNGQIIAADMPSITVTKTKGNGTIPPMSIPAMQIMADWMKRQKVVAGEVMFDMLATLHMFIFINVTVHAAQESGKLNLTHASDKAGRLTLVMTGSFNTYTLQIDI